MNVIGRHFSSLDSSGVAAGTLKHFVTFLEQFQTTDEAGGRGKQSDGLTPRASAFAAIRPASATERARAEQVGHERTHMVLVRYIPNFSSAWRMKWGARLFRVTGVIDVNEAQRYLAIDAVEVADDRG